ncbi:MAG: hypothetical protein C4288_18175 [Leptolyngbya sp. ERB_1_1]
MLFARFSQFFIQMQRTNTIAACLIEVHSLTVYCQSEDRFEIVGFLETSHAEHCSDLRDLEISRSRIFSLRKKQNFKASIAPLF